MNPGNFSVLSYHGSDGAAIADTTTVAGGGILKPTGDDTTGTVANARRKKNITYAPSSAPSTAATSSQPCVNQ